MPSKLKVLQVIPKLGYGGAETGCFDIAHYLHENDCKSFIITNGGELTKFINKKKFILIGSSMGSWLSLNQFKYFKNQIKGFLGIGSAPEFLERLMWKKFTKKMKEETIKKKIYNLKNF